MLTKYKITNQLRSSHVNVKLFKIHKITPIISIKDGPSSQGKEIGCVMCVVIRLPINVQITKYPIGQDYRSMFKV